MTSEKRQLRLDEIRGIEEWAIEELRGEGNKVLAYVDIESHLHYNQNELGQCASELKSVNDKGGSDTIEKKISVTESDSLILIQQLNSYFLRNP